MFIYLLEDHNKPNCLDYVKSYLHVNESFDDLLLENLILSAFSFVEQKIGKTLLFKKYRVKTFIKSDFDIELPFSPHQEIYDVTCFKDFSCTKRGKIFSQSVKNRADNFVIQGRTSFETCWLLIDYKAGFGNDIRAIPKDLFNVLMMVTDFFYNTRHTQQPIEKESFLDLLRPYRMRRL
jgi:uncharacterized phiE125 gp8 family phage protein